MNWVYHDAYERSDLYNKLNEPHLNILKSHFWLKVMDHAGKEAEEDDTGERDLEGGGDDYGFDEQNVPWGGRKKVRAESQC